MKPQGLKRTGRAGQNPRSQPQE